MRKAKVIHVAEGILNGTYLGTVAERRTDSVSSQNPIKNKQIQRGSEKKCCLSWISPRRLFLMSVERKRNFKARSYFVFGFKFTMTWRRKKNEKPTIIHDVNVFLADGSRTRKNQRRSAHKIGSKCRHYWQNPLSSGRTSDGEKALKINPLFCFMYRVCGAWSLGPTFVSQLFTRDDLQQQEANAAETLLLSAGKEFGVVEEKSTDLHFGGVSSPDLRRLNWDLSLRYDNYVQDRLFEQHTWLVLSRRKITF